MHGGAPVNAQSATVGVSTGGIAVTIPSFHLPFVLCGVGANTQAKPRHLYQYAVMATLYAQRVLGIDARLGAVAVEGIA